MDLSVQRAILSLLETGGRGALATVVRASGSTPQDPGARLLLRPDGSLVGTVGGGAIEHAVIEALEACRRTGKPAVMVRDLTRDLGMCCGGSMEILIEPVEAPPRLVIFGAGHVGQATARIASTLGFRVTVVDDRDELNDEGRFDSAERILLPPRAAKDAVAPKDTDFLLITTHDHRLDEEALDVYARLPHRYIGLIGSRRKIYKVLQRIDVRAGLPPLDRVYGPVGLDLGAVTPAEIAVSIAAEIVALRHEKPAPHLRCLGDPQLRVLLSKPIADEDEPSA
jgi:xanthine dehydrogenase accessory factor